MSINNPAYLRLSTASVLDFLTHSPVSTAHPYPVHLPPGCAPPPRRLRVPLLLVPPFRFARHVAHFHDPLAHPCTHLRQRSLCAARSLHPPLHMPSSSTPPHMSRAQRTHTIQRTSDAAPPQRPTPAPTPRLQRTSTLPHLLVSHLPFRSLGLMIPRPSRPRANLAHILLAAAPDIYSPHPRVTFSAFR